MQKKKRERIFIAIIVLALTALGLKSQYDQKLAHNPTDRLHAGQVEDAQNPNRDAEEANPNAGAGNTLSSNASAEGVTVESATSDNMASNSKTPGSATSVSSTSISATSNSEEVAPKIFVHVDGEVNRPGLYAFSSDARIQDAIEAAGGLTEQASLRRINLSMRLQDEMKIVVPDIESEKAAEALHLEDPSSLGSEDSIIVGGRGSGNAPSANETAHEQPKKINLKTATLEDLMTLPSIGEKRAQDILRYREENGFRSVEDLTNISGIGDRTMEKLRALVEVK